MNAASIGEELNQLLSADRETIAQRQLTTFDVESGGRSGSLVLFGCGAMGRRVAQGLRSLGIEPLGFCDNKQTLWGNKVEGLTVFSPREAVDQFGGVAAFVVTVWNDVGGHPLEQIRVQLGALGKVKVVSVAALFWKYPRVFLPFFSLDLPQLTLESAAEIKEGLGLWADDYSRREYLAQIRWRLNLDFAALSPRVTWPAYLPENLFQLRQDECFFDCGAFDGDTLKDYLRYRGKGFDRYLAFEPDPSNFEQLSRFVSSLEADTARRIRMEKVAVGNRVGTICFSGSGTEQASVVKEGGIEVPVTTIDALAKENIPTYVKMDIEGAELDALEGGVQTLRDHAPALAICVYHRYDHLWRLPLFIREHTRDFRFFLRPHREACWDLVCYAVPASRCL